MELKVVIDPIVHKKVMHWVNKSSFEVSGLGIVDTTESGLIKVVDVLLLPQKNGSTHTDIEAEEVNKALFRFKDHPGELRWWWHSHVDMGVFWSGTDMDTIKKIGAGGWFLSTVFNKKSEMRSAYYAKEGLATPWGMQPHFADNLPTSVGVLKLAEAELWDKEYEENVTNVRFQTVSPGWGYGGYDYDDDYSYPWANRTPTYNQDKRPPGMSRREWRRMKKEAEKPYISALPEAPKATINPIHMPVVADDMDSYGFNQEERTLLAEEGWDLMAIDELVQMDFTPSEIIKLAQHRVAPTEAIYLLTHGYTVDDVMALVNDAKLEERL